MSTVSWLHTATGATLYFTLRQPDQRWNGAAMETYVVANWHSYQISMTESPSGGYEYAGTVPSGLPIGWYFADIYTGTLNTPADTLLADQFGYWDGATFQLQAANIVGGTSGGITIFQPLVLPNAATPVVPTFPLQPTLAGVATDPVGNTAGFTITTKYNADVTMLAVVTLVRISTGYYTLSVDFTALDPVIGDQFEIDVSCVFANGQTLQRRYLVGYGSAGGGSDPAQIWGYQARTLTQSGNVSVAIVNPVAQNRDITIQQGDAYNSTTGNAINFLDDGTWPIMTDGSGVQLSTVSVMIALAQQTSETVQQVSFPCVVTGVSPNQVISPTMTAAQTAAIPGAVFLHNVRASVNFPTNTQIRLLISGTASVKSPIPITW